MDKNVILLYVIKMSGITLLKSQIWHFNDVNKNDIILDNISKVMTTDTLSNFLVLSGFGINELFLGYFEYTVLLKAEEQIRWVFDDNWRIIFVSSP